MIRIVVDDLAFLDVDAVLRPATDALEAASPAAAQLDRVGGPALALAHRLHEGLEPGAAVVTPGGGLTAPFVLHLVVRTDERATDRALVRRALTGAWQRAADFQLPRLAAPLIGEGPGQLDPEEAFGLLAATWQDGPAAALPGAELVVVVESESERQLLEDARTAGVLP